MLYDTSAYLNQKKSFLNNEHLMRIICSLLLLITLSAYVLKTNELPQDERINFAWSDES